MLAGIASGHFYFVLCNWYVIHDFVITCRKTLLSLSLTTEKTVKKNHSDNTVYVPLLQEDRQTLTVRRRLIWADTKRALSHPSFNDKIGLNVVFVGEPALDAGGPLREYFRLLWLSLHQNLHLFNGKENA